MTISTAWTLSERNDLIELSAGKLRRMVRERLGSHIEQLKFTEEITKLIIFLVRSDDWFLESNRAQIEKLLELK